jgi:Flp pilus assembly protein TadD
MLAFGVGHVSDPMKLVCAGALAAALGVVASAGGQPVAPAPTFTRDVAPILFAKCASCHRPGEIGPFSLLSYRDARQRATQIADVTARRVMPPWKPEPGKGEFVGARALTEEELRTLQRWVEQGAVEGDPAELPPAPKWIDGWQFGDPDLVVTMAGEYTLPADGPDVFRTFVVPIPTTAPRYVQALEFRPGNGRAVHHANLGVDRTRSSRRLDLQDDEPGYLGGMVPDASYPPGHMLGWTPGQRPRPSPDGAAWRLEPSSDLVVQLHMQPTGKPERVKVSAGFFFTDVAPTRTPVGLRLGSETIDIPAGDPDHVITDDYVVPVDVEVLAIQPHAHNLGRRMEASATLPDGSTRWLISIGDWDFRWQDVYRYAQPVALPRGTAISMRFTYDNSSGNARNPHQPPRRVVWGQNTTDEMGDLWLQLVARDPADFVTLNDDVNRKKRTEDLAAYTKLLRDDSKNPLRHDAVAMLHFEGGQMREAIAHFRSSLALNPGSAPTRYNLGLALSAERRFEEAAEEFREAIRIDPAHAEAHNNLGAMFQVRGDLTQAVVHYRQAVQLRPDNTEALANLGQSLSRLGMRAEAAGSFRAALDLRPEWPTALAGLAWVLATSPDAAGQAGEAVRLAERAAALTGRGDPTALDTLAAAYAAAGRFDEAGRTAESALDLATRLRLVTLADQIRLRWELYKQGTPYHIP